MKRQEPKKALLHVLSNDGRSVVPTTLCGVNVTLVGVSLAYAQSDIACGVCAHLYVPPVKEPEPEPIPRQAYVGSKVQTFRSLQ